jgi:hypothetical protein
VRTTAEATVAAAGWLVTSNFYDTFRVDVSTSTPGASLADVYTRATAPLSGFHFSGAQKVRAKSTARLDRKSSWDMLVDGSEWFGESDQGVSLHGTAAPKGKSGRAFTLTPDAASVAEILAQIAADARASGAGGVSVSLGAILPPAGKWKVNGKRTKAKFALKLPLQVNGPRGLVKGTWTIRLKGAPGRA